MLRSQLSILIYLITGLSLCLADLNLSSVVTDPLYISSKILNVFNASLGVTLGTPQKQVTVEMQITQRNSLASESKSQFVVPTDTTCPTFGCLASSLVTASIGLPTVSCQTRYNETVAIQYFLDSYILPCHKPCWYGSSAAFPLLQNAVLSQFAGVEQYASVLSRGDYPTSSCLLGFYFRSSAADFTVMQKMLSSVQIVSYADTCPQLTGFLRGKKSIGCARARISILMPSQVLSADLYRDVIFTPTRPNSAPQIFGAPAETDLELNVPTPLGPLSLLDTDADYMSLTIVSNGLITVPGLGPPTPTDPSSYVLPPFTPVFTSGGFNVPSHVIQVNATISQAALIVLRIQLTGLALGPVNINITANDQGRTGYPALAPTLQATVAFTLACKPSIRAPSVLVLNSDETFRLDWRPGVRYLRRGNLTTVPDELFPCGGDTMRGVVSFPQGGVGTGPVGWRGVIPPGGGSSAALARDCSAAPSAFFTHGLGEKSMYLTLDEGGKARAYIQMALAPSGCQETNEWKVHRPRRCVAP